MHILICKPKNRTVHKFKKKLDAWGFTYEEINMEAGDLEIRKWFSEEVYKTKAEHVDAIFFFTSKVLPKGVLGRMYHTYYSSYLTAFCGLHRGYEDTAIHELMHMFHDWCNTYYNFSLAGFLGVPDWNKSVVHGEHPDYTEYEYDDVYKKIKPFVVAAITKRKNIAIHSLKDRLTILYKQKVLELQNKIEEIMNIEHPVAGAPITQPYGVRDSLLYTLTGVHIGTDYGVPVGTEIKAPKTGMVIVSGYSASLGYYCHYRFKLDEQIYTARFCHLSSLPEQNTYKQGEVFAVSGNTGFTTGAHLHVDVWRGEVKLELLRKTNVKELTVDPEIIFNS